MSAVHNHSLNCLLWQSRPESRQSESWFVLWAQLKNRLLCEETWWNRWSKARRFFRVVHPFSFLSLLFEQRYTRVLLRNVLVTQFIYPNLWGFFVFVIVHNFFYPHFAIRIRHPQVSTPPFADTSFTSRFFELFILPASLKLNTQRRSAPSMCEFKEEERSVLISVTQRNYRVQNCANYWHHVLYVSEGSNHVTATWKKDFFPFFLYVFLYFFIFLSSAFFYPHFPIRIRQPQVSGPRFTDTRMGDLGNFLNGFAKSPRLIVLNIDWVQFVLKNCEMPYSVRGLYDK